MELTTVRVIDLPPFAIHPYAKNARHIPSHAVDAVASSIKEFGFKVPVVVDRENVIVCGHTRLEAAKRLGLEAVPCVIADDLTDEQVRAFRLADNKTAELTDWDLDLLDEELDAILGLDMSGFGFDLDDSGAAGESGPDDGPKENERHRTDDAYNLGEFDPDRCEGFCQMPVLKGVDHVPSDLIGFNYAKTSEEYSKGVHFYVDDYQFERIWSDPYTSIARLRRFDSCLTPDFSLYLDMPVAMMVWNTYRSRLIGQMMQREGMTVIPTVSWGLPETFTFCFDGLPYGATLSVSTVGIKRGEESLRVYREGVAEMTRRKKPGRILLYGGFVDADYGGAEIVEYRNHVTEAMHGRQRTEQD